MIVGHPRLPQLSPAANKRVKLVREEAGNGLRAAFIDRMLRAKSKRNSASIMRVLKSAPALLKLVSIDDRSNATLRYVDVLAWEYMCALPTAEFETLIGAIEEKARRVFRGDAASVSARTQQWLTEARDRATQGIVGERIPLSVAAKLTSQIGCNGVVPSR
jgi:hypothetical protein